MKRLSARRVREYRRWVCPRKTSFPDRPTAVEAQKNAKFNGKNGLIVYCCECGAFHLGRDSDTVKWFRRRDTHGLGPDTDCR